MLRRLIKDCMKGDRIRRNLLMIEDSGVVC